MIKEWLDSYHPSNREEAKDALREIMQEIALARTKPCRLF